MGGVLTKRDDTQRNSEELWEPWELSPLCPFAPYFLNSPQH